MKEKWVSRLTLRARNIKHINFAVRLVFSRNIKQEILLYCWDVTL